MNAERIERGKSWAVPILLALITVLLSVFGTTSVALLSGINDNLMAMDKRIRANSSCCVENRTRSTVEREMRAEAARSRPRYNDTGETHGGKPRYP